MVHQGNIKSALDTSKPKDRPRTAQNVTKKGKMLNSRPYSKPLQTLYISSRSQKQLKYMPVSGRYLRETFECNTFIEGPIKDLKPLKKWQKRQICSFRALLKPLKAPNGSHGSKKQWKYMPLHSRYLRETFESIWHTGDIAKDLKQLKNGKNAHSGPGS